MAADTVRERLAHGPALNPEGSGVGLLRPCATCFFYEGVRAAANGSGRPEARHRSSDTMGKSRIRAFDLYRVPGRVGIGGKGG